MTSVLQDFMAARKAEIKAQIAALQAELKDIALAEAAIVKPAAPHAGTVQIPLHLNTPKLTIKQMIVDVLRDQPDGADAFKILDLIHAKHGQAIPRSSISPQLSRLKKFDGVLDLRGDKWRLRPNVMD